METASLRLAPSHRCLPLSQAPSQLTPQLPPPCLGLVSLFWAEDVQSVENKGLFLWPHCFLSQRPRSPAKAHLSPPSSPAHATGSALPGARPPAVPQGCPWNRPGLKHEQAVRLGRGTPEPGLGDPLLRWASQPPPTPTAHLDLRSVQKRPLEQR